MADPTPPGPKTTVYDTPGPRTDVYDTDGDGDPTPDPKPSSPAPTAAIAAIAALDPKIYAGVGAMLAQADDRLAESFQRGAINPLLRRLRNTRIVLAFVTACLIGDCLYIGLKLPTEDDLALIGSTTDEDGNLVTLDQRLHTIEEFVVMNTVTSPIEYPIDAHNFRITFTSLQDLLTQLSMDLSLVRGGYKELDDNLEGTFNIVEAMVPHLDCYTERLDNTPDEAGCYDLTCTLGDRTFTHPHRYDWGTSAWIPCD